MSAFLDDKRRGADADATCYTVYMLLYVCVCVYVCVHVCGLISLLTGCNPIEPGPLRFLDLHSI